VDLHPACNNALDSPPREYYVMFKCCPRIACESCTDFLEICMGTLREGIDLGFVRCGEKLQDFEVGGLDVSGSGGHTDIGRELVHNVV
jgi:hypothetical protein